MTFIYIVGYIVGKVWHRLFFGTVSMAFDDELLNPVFVIPASIRLAKIGVDLLLSTVVNFILPRCLFREGTSLGTTSGLYGGCPITSHQNFTISFCV